MDIKKHKNFEIFKKFFFFETISRKKKKRKTSKKKLTQNFLLFLNFRVVLYKTFLFNNVIYNIFYTKRSLKMSMVMNVLKNYFPKTVLNYWWFLEKIGNISFKNCFSSKLAKHSFEGFKNLHFNSWNSLEQFRIKKNKTDQFRIF